MELRINKINPRFAKAIKLAVKLTSNHNCLKDMAVELHEILDPEIFITGTAGDHLYISDAKTMNQLAIVVKSNKQKPEVTIEDFLQFIEIHNQIALTRERIYSRLNISEVDNPVLTIDEDEEPRDFGDYPNTIRSFIEMVGNPNYTYRLHYSYYYTSEWEEEPQPCDNGTDYKIPESIVSLFLS